MADTVLEFIIRTLKEGNAPVELTRELEQLNTGMGEVGKTTEQTTQKLEESTRGVDKHKGAMDTVKESYHEFQAKVATVQMAIGMVQGVIDATAGKFVNYALSVDKGSKLTGMAVEEYSRFVQVADDVGISQDAINRAFEAAGRKGIATNIESVGKLSDGYLALEPGLERSKFLMDNFGRSGMDLVRVMELGSETIRDNSAAVEDGLVMTEEAIQDAKDYALALDNLNDRVTIIQNSIGKLLVDALTKAADAGIGLLDWTKKLDKAIVDHSGDVSKTAKSYAEYREEMIRSMEAAGYNVKVLDDNFQAFGSTARAAGELRERLTEIINAGWELEHPLDMTRGKFDELAESVNKANDQAVYIPDIYGKAGVSFKELYDTTIPLTNSLKSFRAEGLMPLDIALQNTNTRLGDVKQTTSNWRDLIGEMSRDKLLEKMFAGLSNDTIPIYLEKMGLINSATKAWADWVKQVKDTTVAGSQEQVDALQKIIDKWDEIHKTPWMIDIGLNIDWKPLEDLEKDLERERKIRAGVVITTTTTTTTTKTTPKKGGSGGETENAYGPDMTDNYANATELPSIEEFPESSITTYWPYVPQPTLPAQTELNTLAMSNSLYRGGPGTLTLDDLLKIWQANPRNVAINITVPDQNFVDMIARRLAQLVK